MTPGCDVERDQIGVNVFGRSLTVGVTEAIHQLLTLAPWHRLIYATPTPSPYRPIHTSNPTSEPELTVSFHHQPHSSSAQAYRPSKIPSHHSAASQPYSETAWLLESPISLGASNTRSFIVVRHQDLSHLQRPARLWAWIREIRVLYRSPLRASPPNVIPAFNAQ